MPSPSDGCGRSSTRPPRRRESAGQKSSNTLSGSVIGSLEVIDIVRCDTAD
jgi:hypothetical protein